MPKTTSIAERTRSRSPGVRFRGELKNPNAGLDYSRSNKEKEHNTLAPRYRAYDLLNLPMRDEKMAQTYAQISANSVDSKEMLGRILSNGLLTNGEQGTMILNVLHEHEQELGWQILYACLLVILVLVMLAAYAVYMTTSYTFSNVFGMQPFGATPEATPAPFGRY